MYYSISHCHKLAGTIKKCKWRTSVESIKQAGRTIRNLHTDFPYRAGLLKWCFTVFKECPSGYQNCSQTSYIGNLPQMLKGVTELPIQLCRQHSYQHPSRHLLCHLWQHKPSGCSTPSSSTALVNSLCELRKLFIFQTWDFPTLSTSQSSWACRTWKSRERG